MVQSLRHSVERLYSSRCFVEDKRSPCQLSSKRLEDNWHSDLVCSTLTSHVTRLAVWQLSLYKILFRDKALSWESIILLLTPPTCEAYAIEILLHDHCAIHAPPPTPPLNAIHHTILAMAISCKGQLAARWHAGVNRREQWQLHCTTTSLVTWLVKGALQLLSIRHM